MVRTSRGGYWVLAPAAILALSAGSANAAVITFEGTATGGAITVEADSTRTFSGFDVFVGHGHYVDSANPTSPPTAPTG